MAKNLISNINLNSDIYQLLDTNINSLSVHFLSLQIRKNVVWTPEGECRDDVSYPKNISEGAHKVVFLLSVHLLTH